MYNYVYLVRKQKLWLQMLWLPTYKPKKINLLNDITQ